MKIFLSKSARKKQETDNFMGVPIYVFMCNLMISLVLFFCVLFKNG